MLLLLLLLLQQAPHDAGDLVAGTVAAERLGSGTPDSTTFLRGDSVWAAPTAAAAWGSITGTLSSQTDLQTALNAKEPSGAFSGIGACGANTWASTLNDTAAPTCTQPAFSSLSGAATDAQIPNTITIDLAAAATALAADPADCATSTHFAVGITAAGVATCEAIGDADVPNNITIDLATLATTATTANAGDSATAFFSSGTIEDARIDGSAEADELVLAGDVDGTANANDLDELAVEAELESVLDLDQLQGNLGVGHLNGGSGASSSTYWRGDGTWATPAGGSGPTTGILAAPVAVAVNATYVTIFTVTPTASKTNSLSFTIYHAASATTVGVQFRVRSADAGNVGSCAFTHFGINATATSNVGTFSSVIAIGSAPADTASLAAFATAFNRVDIGCAFVSDGTPGDVILEAQLETGTSSINVLAGSSYVYITN